jgi:transforming growth factor-beta-induced protein
MKRLMKWMAALCAAAFLTACGGGDNTGHAGHIADEAQKNKLSALLAAVTKAGIGSSLTASDANLTVFAPTDAAFDKLAKQLGLADGAALVSALSAADLTKILQYHLLAGAKTAGDLKAGSATPETAYRFSGAPAKITLSTSSGVTITDAALTTATVSAADVLASNGVIHVVDKVLVPPGVLTVVQMAQVNPSFSELVKNLVSAKLTDTLSTAGPFTVFAPTDDAFKAASAVVATLTSTNLPFVLKYHVLGSQVLAASIPFGTPVATLNTNKLDGSTVAAQTFTITNNPLQITDATGAKASIAATDVRASNGVIHVINKVLVPN